MATRDFTIDIPQAMLDDLRHRLKNTRWPNEIQPTGWQKGTELHYMQQLTRYWIEEYDWRAVEANLNRFKHYVTKLNGLDIHYIHEKSSQSNAVPVVLLHGWCDSFYSYIGLIDRLCGRNGRGKNSLSFNVIIPSLPGFDFSSQPGEGQMKATLAANIVAKLMESLGYEKYVVHGGDWGSAVAQELARTYTDRVTGLHLNDVPFGNYFMVDREQASEAEKELLTSIESWGTTEAGYVSIQSTKPLTLSYGLSDSPVGLAAWLIQHFQRLCETLPGYDDLITNVMLYWFNNTIRSSIRYYNEGMGDDWDSASTGASDWSADETSPASAASEWSGDSTASSWDMKINVPTAIALFPRDIGHPPREFAERFFDIKRFTTMKHGGHFAALEVPELLADDIRAFVASLEK